MNLLRILSACVPGGVLIVAAGAQSIEYVVTIANPGTQTLTVTMTAHGVTGKAVDVSLPAWRPGKYVILDPATTIRRVWDPARENSHPVEKVAKSTWRVPTRGADTISIAYEVYANSLQDRTRHVDDTHAFIDGSAVFMFVPELRDAPATVRIQAPREWRVASGLAGAPGDPRTLTAPNYDVLVDSPIEVGLHDAIAFDVDGVPHEIIVWGEAHYDAERLKNDFAVIVNEQADLFGNMPYDRYVYIIHVGEGLGGGTEHWNSTVMQTSPRFAETESSYQRFLGLVSHEMFHTWNVKRLRPAGLVPYDYLRENYTDLLWVAEGTTSYYDDLVLVRTGLIDTDEYLRRLASSHASLLGQPGRSLQSLEASSLDAWIKFNRSWPDKDNTTISFYSKGALVSLLLDLEIRARTGSNRSLDDVMRTMYQRFPLDAGGFTAADLQQTIEELAGTSFDSFFSAFVRGTVPLPLESAFTFVGLTLHEEPIGDDEPEFRPYIGLDLIDRDGLAEVRSVSSDGPAFIAGVMTGDLIVALNGRRLRAGELDNNLKRVEPGSEIVLTLFRRNRLREIRFPAAARKNTRWVLECVDSPTNDQKSAYESWLNQPWPGDDE